MPSNPDGDGSDPVRDPDGDADREGGTGSGSPTDPRSPVAEAAYDELADTYADGIESNPYNADLAFPATTELVPDVAGRRVLDAGCGTGLYAEWLRERGADVVGVDVSAGMLARARDRLLDGDADADGTAALCRGDLGSPLGFADGAFDGVVCALALDYVRDWGPTVAEFARVLAPGGFVVVTVPHPFDEFPLDEGNGDDGGNDDDGRNADDGHSGGNGHDGGDEPNYFAVERRVKGWAVDVPYYRRPLSATVDPFLDAGFRIDALTEPRPTERFRERRPDRYGTESRRPTFLSIRGVLSTDK